MKNNRKNGAIFLMVLLLFQCINFGDLINIKNQKVYAFNNTKMQSNSPVLIATSDNIVDDKTLIDEKNQTYISNNSSYKNNKENIVSDEKESDSFTNNLSSLTDKVINDNKINQSKLVIQDNTNENNKISTSTSSSISLPEPSNTSTSSSISKEDNIPTAPGELTVTTGTSISITLGWTPSISKIPIAEYDIYDEEDLIGTTTGGAIEFTVENLKENRMYSFTVKAKDEAGNISQPSNVVKVSTEIINSLIMMRLQAVDPSNNLSRTASDYFGKSGVYAPTGNYSRTFTDMNIPAPGFAFNFNRTYNSLDSGKGVFGKGWTSSILDAKIIFNENVEQPLNRSYYNELDVTLPDGSTDKFTLADYDIVTQGVWENNWGLGMQLNKYTYKVPKYYTSRFSRNKIYYKDNGNSYMLTLKNNYSYGFDYYGNMRYMKDNNGNIVRIGVDSDDKVHCVTDAVNRTFKIDYNNQNLISSITDSEKRIFTYSYDSNGNLTTVTDPMQHTITYEYDSNNLLSKIKDKNSNTIESMIYIHDGSENKDKILQDTDEYGNVHTYTYDTGNKKTTITDSNKKQLTQSYDNDFFITSAVDQEGKATSTAYNNKGEVISETDRNGNTTKYTRDSNGNVTNITNPDGSCRIKTYDSQNNVTSQTDENGNSIYYNYDANNNIIVKAQSINGKDQFTGSNDTSKFVITNYSYYSGNESGCSAKNLLKSESVTISPTEANITTYTYDTYGNINTITDSEGKVTTNTYNSIGWKTSSKSPEGFITTYLYDNNGNIEKQQLNNGETIRVIYDNNGRKIKSITPNEFNLSSDNISQHSYNGDCGYRYTYYTNGKPKTVTDPENNTTTYTYDIYGNILTETKPSKAVYKYEYDIMNRPIKYYVQEDSNSPWILLEEYSYNIIPGADGTPSQTQKIVTKHLNNTDIAVTVTNYDYAGRVLSIKNADGTQSSKTYNKNGTVASTTDPRGSVSYYKYDGLNRQTESWAPIENSFYTYGIKTYDNAGRIISEKAGKDKVALWSVPNNFVTLNYSYYKNGKLKSTVDGEGRKKVYAYDNDGNIIREDVYTDASNFVTTEYTNNHMGKPLTKNVHVKQGDISGNDISNTTNKVLTTTYTYDNNGNLKTMITPNNITTTYTYDKMDRQTSVSMPGIDETDNSATITKSTTYNWDGKPLTVTDANGNITSNMYSNRGLLLTVTDAKGGISAYQYDIAGRKTCEVSPVNYIRGVALNATNHIEYTYDLMDRLKTKTEVYVDKSGAVTKSIVTKAFKYDANGKMIKELDALGYKAGNSLNVDENIEKGYGTITNYNLQGKVSTVLDAESKERKLPYTKKYDYDALGRKVAETNANGVTTSYYYDDAENVKRVTVSKASGEPEATQKAMTYDYLGNLLTSTDGNGNTITYENNSFGKVRKKISPGDNSISSYTIIYQYDVMGNVSQSIDSMYNEDVYTYDSQGRELSHTRLKNDGSDAITTSTSYDKNGNKRFKTDGNGVKTEYIYDQLNRNVSTTVADQTTTNMYDGNGNIILVEDWRGNTNTNVYDPFDKLIQKINADGTIMQKLAYYDNGLQSTSYDALGVQYLNNGDATHCTKFSYDKNGRLLSTTDVLNHTTSQTYDNVGNIKTKTDANNNTTIYNYDEYNKLISVTNPKNETTSYTYDLNGNKLTETDAKNNTTSFVYNVANKISNKIDAGGKNANLGYDPNKTESYSYNPDGTLYQKIDRNGVVTTNLYDAHGRKLSQTTGDITISYNYDNNGNILSETDLTGTTIRTYDDLNRTTTKTVPDMGTSTYVYDIIPNNQGQYGYTSECTIDPLGNTVIKTYDKEGRLKTVQVDGKTTTYNYDINGNRQSVVYSDGSSETYTYYEDNTLKTLTNKKADGTIIDNYSYTYDATHNIISKTDSKGITNYKYDSLNRLLTVSEPNGKNTAYTYDQSGNRQTEIVTQGSATQVTSLSYNEQNRLVSTTVTVNDVILEVKNYSYDNNGNVTKILRTPYTNGVAQPSQLTENIYDSLNQLIVTTTPNGTMECNIYNGDGYRVSKAVNGQITRYLYEGDKVILEEDGNGSQIAKNVYGINLISRTLDNNTLFYMYNGHGDVTALINETGAIVGLYYYDAFGNIVESSGNVNNPYTYSGYQYDKETGLYYCNARMYDPKTARFLQEDTFSGDPNDPLSLNRYTYCVNNPLVYHDSTGHWPNWSGFFSGIKDSWNSFTSSCGSVVNNFSSAWNTMSNSFNNAWNNTVSNISTAMNSTINTWNSALNSTTSTWGNAFNKTTDAFGSAWNNSISTIDSMKNSIGNSLTNSFNSLDISNLNTFKFDTSSWNIDIKLPNIPDFTNEIKKSLKSFDLSNEQPNFANKIVDAIFPGSYERAEKLLNSKYDFGNWATFGMFDTVKGAINPKNPLSFQHWMDSAATASMILPGAGLISGQVDALLEKSAISGISQEIGSGITPMNLQLFGSKGVGNAKNELGISNITNTSPGQTIFGELDSLGRPTGMTATVTEDMIGTGTKASQSIKPPGFEGGGPGSPGHARGHLLGKQLGGPGDDPRNLVTLFQNPVNSPVMRDFESSVRAAVENGEVVRYKSIPIYEGNNLIPSGVTMSARGTGGFQLDVTVVNRK